jgi:methionyl-tRNA formyltransferase
MCDVIDLINSGNVPREKQDDTLSSYAAKIEKEDTIADFTKSPETVVNLIRGLSPAPCVATKTPDGKLLKLPSARVIDGACDKEAGTVVDLDTAGEGKIVISCGGGLIAVTSVTPEGKKRMAAADYIRGRKINIGDILKY